MCDGKKTEEEEKDEPSYKFHSHCWMNMILIHQCVECNPVLDRRKSIRALELLVRHSVVETKPFFVGNWYVLKESIVTIHLPKILVYMVCMMFRTSSLLEL